MEKILFETQDYAICTYSHSFKDKSTQNLISKDSGIGFIEKYKSKLQDSESLCVYIFNSMEIKNDKLKNIFIDWIESENYKEEHFFAAIMKRGLFEKINSDYFSETLIVKEFKVESTCDAFRLTLTRVIL